MFNQLLSSWQSFQVALQRQADHAYRRFIGVPTLRRSEITPQLYLGGQYTWRGFQILRDRGVTAIVSMRTRPRHGLPDLGEIKFLHLPTPDLHAPTLTQLEAGVAFITQVIADGGKVYIHCAAGEGRGPTMTAAYLMSTGMTVEDALANIRAVRTFIRVTQPQLERLKELDKKYHQS